LMMSGGGALEAWAAGRARRELRLLVERAPRIAHRHGAEGVEEVSVEQLVPGDLVVVRAGEIVPADATVAGSVAVVDQSALTGEPLPVTIPAGGEVRSGTSNAGNVFNARVTRPASESAYAAVVELVRTAESDRAPFTRLADRYAAVFLPFTLAVAGLAWAASGDPVRGLAVMVVATPCPLILAAPIAIVAGISRCARAGVLIKGGAVFETLARGRVLVLDKTGTLTEGKPRVVAIAGEGAIAETEVLRLAAAVERGSEHPLAAAIVAGAAERGLPIETASGFQSLTGKGVTGRLALRRIAVGSRALMGELGVDASALASRADALRADAATVVFVAADGRLAGLIAIADPIRASAPDALRRLIAEGVRVVMVTGDNHATAAAVAAKLGIADVVAEVLPDQKRAEVERLQAAGRVVAMAGDGINDAPALAQAQVGIAMGTGTDVAMESAAVTLVKGDLQGIARARTLSRATMANVRQNLFFAFAYNTLGVPIAAGVLYPMFGLLLSPMIAAAAMSWSSVSVIGNALRLRRVRL